MMKIEDHKLRMEEELEGEELVGGELVGKNLASLVADPTKSRLIMTCFVTN